MSGGNVAYHLRPNKAIERQLFFDLLMRVRANRPLSEYTYVGMGGPFLEDFRQVHALLGIRRMISLEQSQKVFARQKFNRPMTCIRCSLKSSGDFIDEFNPRGNYVLWLDYASPREIRKQIQEFQALLPKLSVYDIVKITLNANPRTLLSGGEHHNKTVDELAPKQLAELSNRIGDFLPDDVTASDMTKEHYPRVLLRAVERASRIALRGTPALCFEILSSFAYADSEHKMLTVTGVLITEAEREAFLKRSGLLKWEFRLGDDRRPVEIMVPSLSTRERMFIDALLPRSTDEKISKRMKFLCEESEEKSRKAIASYARFYRHLPYFSRIIP